MELGIDPTYLSHLEAGRRDPSLDLLRRMARVFKVPDGVFLAAVLAADLPEDKRHQFEPVIRKLIEVSVTLASEQPA